jgi:N-acetylglucosaminyl-diphospho-decaprenol L-rhamnosyltransferase
MAQSPTVGVVTVTYNTGETLRQFLDSLVGSSSVPLEVVVVDNASDDAPGARALCTERGARFLGLASNTGYGAGIGAGIVALDGSVEFILISNPDVTLTPGCIDALIDGARRYPRAGAFGPLIVDADGSTYPSARKLPSLRTGIGHALFMRVWPTNPWTKSYREESTLIEEREAGWLSGACLLVRASAFEAIDGFDEGYFMYFEDVDLGARMTKAGWANMYIPGAVVTHTGAHSTAQHSQRMDRVHHDSAYRYLSRKYSAWYLWPLRVALRVGLTTRSKFTSRKR